MRFVTLATAMAVAVTGLTPDMSLAKDKKFKTIPPGQIQRQKSGPKPIPPGQIKRYTRGQALGKDVVYTDITDLARWRLGKPPKDEKYVQVGDQILRVAIATLTVVAVMGLVDELLD